MKVLAPCLIDFFNHSSRQITTTLHLWLRFFLQAQASNIHYSFPKTNNKKTNSLHDDK